MTENRAIVMSPVLTVHWATKKGDSTAAARIFITACRENITFTSFITLASSLLLLLVVKALSGLARSYIRICLSIYTHSHSLRSSTAGLLNVLKINQKDVLNMPNDFWEPKKKMSVIAS